MKRTLAICLLLLFALTGSAFGLTLQLREQATVQGDTVTLGQVVVPTAAMLELADLPLFQAPEAGRERLASAGEIQRAILLQRPELADNLSLQGPMTVRVLGGGQLLTAADLEGMLGSYLESQRGRLPRAQIRFRDLRLPAEIIVPKGRLSHQVIPSNPDILSSSRFSLILRVDGTVVKNLTLSGRLEALAPVAVTLGDLRRGATLGPQDLNMVVTDIVSLREPCFDLNELVGKRLKRSVRAGVPLDRSTVDFPPMVARGQVVTISVQTASLTLTARGEAQQAGQRGDTIRVRNLTSNRDVRGRIVGPGQVLVEM